MRRRKENKRKDVPIKVEKGNIL